jgi:hypothetical protein
MAIALVSATALAVADRVADLVVTALALDPAAPVVMVPADLAATIVVAMTADLPASKMHRSSAPSSPALSSPTTRSLKFSVAR